MKYLIIGIFCSSALAAQTQHTFVQRENGTAVVAGMGINLVNAPDIVDYINATAVSNQRVDDFATAVDFFGGVEFPVSEEWGLKFEYSYLFKSYTFLATTGATHDFFYSAQAPSIIVQRVISGDGFFVKMGAGGGYHFGTAEEKISTFGTSTNYSASGFGMKAEIVGQTAFDENFYGYIGGQLGWEMLGSLKNSNQSLQYNQPQTGTQTAALNYFFAGLRFGVTYYL